MATSISSSTEIPSTKPPFPSGDASESLYDAFVFVLAPTILTLALVMCCARVVFVYYSYKRERQMIQRTLRRRRSTFSAYVVEYDHDGLHASTHVPADLLPPPPSYEDVNKDISTARLPPPAYSSIRLARSNSVPAALPVYSLSASSQPPEQLPVPSTSSSSSRPSRHTIVIDVNQLPP